MLTGRLFFWPEVSLFSSRRAGQTLYCESDGLQQTADYPLGAVSSEDAVGTHGGKEATKDGLVPHFRLLFGRKGIEIDSS